MSSALLTKGLTGGAISLLSDGLLEDFATPPLTGGNQRKLRGKLVYSTQIKGRLKCRK